MIHFYPNLVVKLAKISPKMVVKNDVIFGKTPPPPPKPMTSFMNDPLQWCTNIITIQYV